MKKYLVIKYFDTYPEAEKRFDTEQEAKLFVAIENEKLINGPKTYWAYKGECTE